MGIFAVTFYFQGLCRRTRSINSVFFDVSGDFSLLFFFKHVLSCCSTHSRRQLTLRHEALFFLVEFVSKVLPFSSA